MLDDAGELSLMFVDGVIIRRGSKQCIVLVDVLPHVCSIAIDAVIQNNIIIYQVNHITVVILQRCFNSSIECFWKTSSKLIIYSDNQIICGDI